MRSALAALLGREHDIEVTATPWRNAPRRARSLRPQVCVVDVECPGADQDNVAQLTELTELPGHAAGQECALLVLATASRPGLLRRASQARALGFVNKNAAPEELVRGIRRVAMGERFVDNSLAFDFLQAADIPLTPRELSVLSLAAEGASIGEIARVLHLCNGTVRNYMAAITRKTGARNRVDAIRISRVAGWL